MNDCLLPYLQCVLISHIYFKRWALVVNLLSLLLQDLNKIALVSIFFGTRFLVAQPPDMKAGVVKQYSDVNVTFCIIFATASFGMGVNYSGIHQIINIVVTRIMYSRNKESRSLWKACTYLSILLYIHESNKEVLEHLIKTKSRQIFFFFFLHNYEYTDLMLNVCAENPILWKVCRELYSLRKTVLVNYVI